MARATRDYGLPRLTVAEAARILGITPTAFTDWIAEYVKPTMSQWSNWRSPDGPGLPEALLRLYLTHRAEGLTTGAQAPLVPPEPEQKQSAPVPRAADNRHRASLGADKKRRAGG